MPINLENTLRFDFCVHTTRFFDDNVSKEKSAEKSYSVTELMYWKCRNNNANWNNEFSMKGKQQEINNTL